MGTVCLQCCHAPTTPHTLQLTASVRHDHEHVFCILKHVQCTHQVSMSVDALHDGHLLKRILLWNRVPIVHPPPQQHTLL